MYVCVCNAISETQVRAAIEDGATTREAVTRACSAGGDCGACHGMIDDMIEAHRDACGASRGGACEEASGPQLVSADRLVRERAA